MSDATNASGKIFGIGFHKTGTTSLARALRLLGYRVTGTFGVHDPGIAQHVRSSARKRLEQFDAFQDNPWPLLYRELDEWCPGSKFILTIRPSDKWIESVAKHFGGESRPMRVWIYGVGDPRGNEATYVARYDRHNQEVLEYFRHRPDDLLVYRLTEGDGWEQLCRFLGRSVPEEPFPHVNRAERREGLRYSPVRMVVQRLSRIRRRFDERR